MTVAVLFSCFLFFSLFILSLCASTNRIIYHDFDGHETVWVYESKGFRYLSFANPGGDSQTCINLSDPKKLVFNYQHMLVSGLITQSDPKRVCIVGLGGGTLSTAVATLFPLAEIDHVEINVKMIDYAQQFFYFHLTDKMKFFIEDGSKYFQLLPPDVFYDIIILDAFDACYVPKDFLTLPFIQSLNQHLTANGIVLVNTFKHSPSYDRETNLYRAVFENVYSLLPLFPIHGNRIILACNSPIQTQARLKSRLEEMRSLLQSIGVSYDQVVLNLNSLKSSVELYPT